ncbi:hypothetical protein JHK85_028220 [Glycine max]|nr:hypothetical protein JHK85_028220 [Glycine max]
MVGLKDDGECSEKNKNGVAKKNDENEGVKKEKEQNNEVEEKVPSFSQNSPKLPSFPQILHFCTHHFISFNEKSGLPLSKTSSHDRAWMARRRITIIYLCVPSDTIASGWRRGVGNDHNLSPPTSRLTVPE